MYWPDRNNDRCFPQVFSKAAASVQGEPSLKAALNALPTAAPVPPTTVSQHESGKSGGEVKSKSDQLKAILAGNPQRAAHKNSKKYVPKKSTKSLGIDFSKRPKKDN